MASLHSLQALGQDALDRSFEGEDLQRRRRARDMLLSEPTHRSFQSSSESTEPRGATGLSRIACQARPLTAAIEMPARPGQCLLWPDHGDIGAPVVEPNLVRAGRSDDVEQNESAVLAASAAMAAASLRTPLAASTWTKLTTEISGFVRRARSTASGSTAW